MGKEETVDVPAVPPAYNGHLGPLDQDLRRLNYGGLEAEVVKLRAGIRKQRDATGHDLCWWSELWELLPESETPKKPTVPPRKEFLAKCGEFHAKLVKTLIKNRT